MSEAASELVAMAHPVTGVALKSRKVLRPLAMGYKLYPVRKLSRVAPV